MDTIDLMDFTGATVRIAYVGQGVINEQRRDLSGKMCYAVDIPLNGRNARVWRYPRDIQVIALRRTIKSKSRPTVSLFHNYMEFSATKPVDVIAPTPTLIDVNKPLETQEQAVIAEIKDTRDDKLRDAFPVKDIQTHVMHLAVGDVLRLDQPMLPREHDYTRWHIHSITPFESWQPRKAVVVVFTGKDTPDGVKWALSGSTEVTFNPIGMLRFWNVCGGPKLSAAHQDKTLLVPTNMLSLPRWAGKAAA